MNKKALNKSNSQSPLSSPNDEKQCENIDPQFPEKIQEKIFPKLPLSLLKIEEDLLRQDSYSNDSKFASYPDLSSDDDDEKPKSKIQLPEIKDFSQLKKKEEDDFCLVLEKDKQILDYKIFYVSKNKKIPLEVLRQFPVKDVQKLYISSKRKRQMEVGRVRRLRKRLMKNNDSKFQRIIRRVNDKILLEMYYNILEEEKEINEIEQETKRIIESNQKDHSQCIPKFAKNDKKQSFWE